MSLSNAAAISAEDARHMRLASAWALLGGNTVVRDSVDKRKRHTSIKVDNQFLERRVQTRYLPMRLSRTSLRMPRYSSTMCKCATINTANESH